jgi:FAD/FMN-containing dehydrogenase
MISSTGVGGLTLGGGIGHLSRKYGLTIDNLLAADLVLADGSSVTASAEENQDLFWAVRGGGGNFGVVTSFLFRTHPVATVYAGPTFWPLEQAADVLRHYREFIVEAPEDVSGFFAFLVVPPAPMFPEHLHNRKMCGIVWCCTGPTAEASKAIEPMIRFREPALSMVDSLPFPVLQSMFDALYTPGMQWYWKADYFKELSDPAVALQVEHASRIPTLFSTMHLYPINGAVHRVEAGDTAFNCRDATWAEVIVGVDPDPANADKIIDWTRSYWNALHPYSVGTAYVNFMMEEGQDRVRASYGENYRRLAAIKRKYDPANFFRVNQNIQPAAASASG